MFTHVPIDLQVFINLKNEIHDRHFNQRKSNHQDGFI